MLMMHHLIEMLVMGYVRDSLKWSQVDDEEMIKMSLAVSRCGTSI
jgi:hypothetical protein